MEVLALLQLLLGDLGSPCVTTLVASLPLEALLAAQQDLTCCFVALRPFGGHLEVTWRSLGGHLETTCRPLGGQVGARGAKLCSRRLQVGPKRRPRGSKLGSRNAKLAPRGAKLARRSAKLAPRGAQEAPSWTEQVSKRARRTVQKQSSSL